MAGIVPGFMLAAMLRVAIYISARRLDTPRIAWGGWRNPGREGGQCRLGPAAGRDRAERHIRRPFTLTEAAATSAVYAFVIAVFVYRDLKLKDVFPVLLHHGGPPFIAFTSQGCFAR